MALFRVRAIGTINNREEETFYIVSADNEQIAIEKFNKIQPETDPEFEIETFDIELYTSDSVAIVDESLCAI